MLLFQEHGELEFRRGDVITVTDKSDQVNSKKIPKNLNFDVKNFTFFNH